MSRAVRSKDRAVAVIYRVSAENRARLHERAKQDGYATLQDWIDAKLLGEVAQNTDQQEELPLTPAS